MSQATYRFYIDLTGDGDFVDADENISAYVIFAEWELGFRPFDTIGRQGNAILTLNNTDRRFSPENTGSPYFDVGTKTNILPLRSMKITMDTGGGETTMFTGLINRLEVAPGTKMNRRAILRCTDNSTLTIQRRIRDFALQQDQRSDVVLLYLLDNNITFGTWLLGIVGKSELGIATELGGPRFSDTSQIQTGLETFQYIGDTWFNERVIIAKAIQDIVQSEGFPARFYYDRQGRPVFWNRQYLQARTDTPTNIIADSDAIGMNYDWGARVYNNVVVSMTPRELATGTEVIFINRSRAIKIGFGETKSIRALFVDDVGARVGATELVTPELGTDYTINTAADGSGSDVTTGITTRLTERPEHAEIIFQSNNPTTVYIRNLQLRGRKLRHFNPSEISARNGESESLYGKRDLTIAAPLLNDPDIGDGIARLMLSIRSKPESAIFGLTIANADAAQLAQIEGLTIGTRIALTEGQTDLAGEVYILTSERHVVTGGGTFHTVTYGTEPQEAYNFWLLGIAGRSGLGETTKLGV